MQEGGLRATLHVTRFFKSTEPRRTEECTVFQISSEEEPLVVGRKHETFRTEKSISRSHFRLWLMRDGTIEVVRLGQAPISLRDKENGPLMTLLKDIPVIMYKNERIILSTSDPREYEIVFTDLKTKDKLDATGPLVKLVRVGSRPRDLFARVPSAERIRRPFAPVVDDLMDIDSFLLDAPDAPAEAPVEAPRPKITIDVDVHIDNGASGSVKRRRIVFDEDDDDDEDDADLFPPIPARWGSQSQPSQGATQVAADSPDAGSISQLREMFPDRSSDILVSVLRSRGSMEAATDFLLMLGHVPDGALASLLLQHGASESLPQMKAVAPAAFERKPFLPPPGLRIVGTAAKPSLPDPVTPAITTTPLDNSSAKMRMDIIEARLIQLQEAAKRHKFPKAAISAAATPTTSPVAEQAAPIASSSLASTKPDFSVAGWKSLLKTQDTVLSSELNQYVESLLAEVSRLKAEVEAKESEVHQVTGGFSFEVWSRLQREKITASGTVQQASSAMATQHEECAVCFEVQTLVSARCGCAILCATCLPTLVSRNDGCPKCLQPLVPKVVPRPSIRVVAKKAARQPREPPVPIPPYIGASPKVPPMAVVWPPTNLPLPPGPTAAAPKPYFTRSRGGAGAKANK